MKSCKKIIGYDPFMLAFEKVNMKTDSDPYWKTRDNTMDAIRPMMLDGFVLVMVRDMWNLCSDEIR